MMKAKPRARIPNGPEFSFRPDRNSGVQEFFSAGLGSDLPVPTQNAMKAKPSTRIPDGPEFSFHPFGSNALLIVMKTKPSTKIPNGIQFSFRPDRNSRSSGVFSAGLGSDLPVPAQNTHESQAQHKDFRWPRVQFSP